MKEEKKVAVHMDEKKVYLLPCHAISLLLILKYHYLCNHFCYCLLHLDIIFFYDFFIVLCNSVNKQILVGLSR